MNVGGEASAGVRFPPPLIFAGLLLAGLAADDWLGLRPAIPGAVRSAGAVIVVIGLVPIA
ncbi:hypothetical protein [Croceicoccus marinus]|uniref:hypothetical protein n=1 Tax=Croceicoccus marinus TaxID=450378 RepID=UPI000A409F79|nr:hypothetical protein [Croceicoccus marinus]